MTSVQSVTNKLFACSHSLKVIIKSFFVVILSTLLCTLSIYMETFSVTWEVSIKVHLGSEFPLSQYQTHVIAHHSRARHHCSDESSLSISGLHNRNHSVPLWTTVYTYLSKPLHKNRAIFPVKINGLVLMLTLGHWVDIIFGKKTKKKQNRYH